MAPWLGRDVKVTIAKRSLDKNVTIAIVLGIIAALSITTAGYLILRFLRPKIQGGRESPPASKQLPNLPISSEQQKQPYQPPPYSAAAAAADGSIPQRPFRTSRVQSFQRMLKATKIRSILFNKNKPLPPPPPSEDFLYVTGETKSGANDISATIMFQRSQDDTLRSQVSEDFLSPPRRPPKLDSTTYSLPPVIIGDALERPYSLQRPTYPESPSSSSFAVERFVSHPYGPRATQTLTESELAYNRMTRESNFSYDESDWNITAASSAPPPARNTVVSEGQASVVANPSLRRKAEVKYKRSVDLPAASIGNAFVLPDILESNSAPPSPPTEQPYSSSIAVEALINPPPPSRLPVKIKTRSQLTSGGSFDISSYYRFSSTVPRPEKHI